MTQAYAHAHYIWYFFVGVGLVALVAILIFGYVTNRIDARNAMAETN